MNAQLKPTDEETAEQRFYRLYQSPEAIEHFRAKYPLFEDDGGLTDIEESDDENV